jgi:hypothetical protein
VTQVAQGVYQPPSVDLDLEGTVVTVNPSRVQLHELRKEVGPVPGICVISYPCWYARDDTPQMGKRATVYVGGVKLFRGVVGDVPYEIDREVDQTWLRLYDDRWPLSRGVVGQGGIGTQGTPAGARGFQHVGFDVVLNANGKANKDGSSLDFNLGTVGTTWWTCKTALQFLFAYYVDSDIARITVSALSSNWDRVPYSLSLTGLTIVQAIDQLAQAAGESWTLVPNQKEEYSDFRPVRPGYGTVRRCRLFTPRRGATADSVSDEHPVRVSGGRSIRNCRDVVQVMSGNSVKETSYSNTGSDPLLTQEVGFVDGEYAARFVVDVTKYAAHTLGGALAAGAPPKPWLSHLLTRVVGGAAYAGAGTVVYDQYPRAEPVVWLSSKTGTTPYLRITDGYRLDCQHCHLDLKAQLTYVANVNSKPVQQKLDITDWSTVGIYLTVATVLEYCEYVWSADGNQYLPKQYFHVIRRPDLVPEYRQDSYLPSLSAGYPNGSTLAASGAEEEYLDITARLQAIRDAAFAAMNQVECPFEAQYDFTPEMEIGDRLLLQGRQLGASGNEVIVGICYRFRHGIPNAMHVRATNLVVATDPDDAGVEAQS